jgi:hypothetical protein
MRRRWRFLLMLVMLLLVTGSFLLPAVHWRVIGWIKGEAFYEGRPTSYWAHEMQQWGPPCYAVSTMGGAITYRSDPFWFPQPSWWDQLREQLGGPPPVAISSQPLLVDARDPTAIPVLIELLEHPDNDIRLIAVYALGQIGPDAQVAVPLLLNMIEDGNRPGQEYATTDSLDRLPMVSQE